MGRLTEIQQAKARYERAMLLALEIRGAAREAANKVYAKAVLAARETYDKERGPIKARNEDGRHTDIEIVRAIEAERVKLLEARKEELRAYRDANPGAPDPPKARKVRVNKIKVGMDVAKKAFEAFEWEG